MIATTAEQRIEAIERMELQKIDPNIIEKFKTSGTIMLAQPNDGGIEELPPKELEYIRSLEAKYGMLAYFVFRYVYAGYLMDSVLYVEREKDEWEWSRHDLDEGYAMTYTINHDVPMFSEFGSVGVTVRNGIPSRY